VQADRIARPFDRQAQHRTRKFVRAHRRIADRLERQPRLIEGRFQNDQRLRIE